MSRLALYGLVAILALSGSVWLLAHYGRPDDSLPGPLEPWAMKLHGAAAMGSLYLLGTMLHGHMLHGWRMRRNRAAGMVISIALGLLVLSGYGLYYFDGDALRRCTEWLHWIVGLGLPGVLAWHIVKGRALRRGGQN